MGGRCGTESPGGATHSSSVAPLTKHVFRIEFHAKFFEERAKFLLKTKFAVVGFLVANISCHSLEIDELTLKAP